MNLKQFVVSAIPNTKTWCDEDCNYYSHLLNKAEQDDGSILLVFNHYYSAENEEKALDLFHVEWPIKCLDDWEIECNEMNPEIATCPNCQTRFMI